MVSFWWWMRRVQIRYWWHERLPWWVAMRLPRKVALFAFIRVYAATGDCLPDYDPRCRLWEQGAGQ